MKTKILSQIAILFMFGVLVLSVPNFARADYLCPYGGNLVGSTCYQNCSVRFSGSPGGFGTLLSCINTGSGCSVAGPSGSISFSKNCYMSARCSAAPGSYCTGMISKGSVIWFYNITPVNTVYPAVVLTNGSCGASNGQTFTTAPTGNYCQPGKGIFSGLSGSGPWTWSCLGSGGGSTANCSAQIASPPPVYNCSSCSSIYSFANEAYKSYNADCSTKINGTSTYSQNCSCGAKSSDPFNYTPICSPPTMSLSSDISTIDVDKFPNWNSGSGTPITLSWIITGSTTCTKSSSNGAWTGTTNVTGQETVSQKDPSVNYILSCDNGAGTKNVTVVTGCHAKVCGNSTCGTSTSFSATNVTNSSQCAQYNKCSTDSDCQPRTGSEWQEVAP